MWKCNAIQVNHIKKFTQLLGIYLQLIKKWTNWVNLTGKLNIYVSTLFPSFVATFCPSPLSSSTPSSVYSFLYFFSLPVYHILTHSPVFPIHSTFTSSFPFSKLPFTVSTYIYFFLPIYSTSLSLPPFSLVIQHRISLTPTSLVSSTASFPHPTYPPTNLYLPTFLPSDPLPLSLPPYPCSPRQS